jgi:hypothetical protein
LLAHRAVVFAVVASLLLLQGCSDPYEEGYKEGYNLGHAKGIDEGHRTGFVDGRDEGLKRGEQRAEEVAASGRALKLYVKPVLLCWVAGAAIGILLQYLLIYVFRTTFRLSWIGIALVPGLSDSRCFCIQTQLGIVALEKRRQLEEIRSRTELKQARIESVRRVAVRRLEASSDLESVLLKKILANAEKEMRHIVEEAEDRRANRLPQRREHRYTK